MLPFAEIYGAASSPQLEAPAVLEVRADHGARVDIDGATYGQAPVEVRVPAGEHRIEVFAAGYHPWRATVQLGAKSRVTMITDLLAAEPAVDESPSIARAGKGRPGVFLPTPRRRVFMDQMRAADGSALLASAPEGAGSSGLKPTRPEASRPEGRVFLPTTPPRTFLPTTRTSPPASDFMPNSARVRPDGSTAPTR